MEAIIMLTASFSRATLGWIFTLTTFAALWQPDRTLNAQNLPENASDVVLESLVPRESQFAGFSIPSSTGRYLTFVIAPELPATAFAKECDIQSLFQDRNPIQASEDMVPKAIRSLRDGGYSLIRRSPSFTFERGRFTIQSLEIPREVAGGEICGFLGYNFLKGTVLKYRPSPPTLQILNASADSRKPIRRWRGKHIDGERLQLSESLSLNGVSQNVILRFLSQFELSFGFDVHRGIPESEIGKRVSVNTTYAANRKLDFQRTRHLFFHKQVELDGISLNQVCYSLTEKQAKLEIGWGLLQKWDFEIIFSETEFDFLLYGLNAEPSILIRDGEFQSRMTEDGLLVESVAEFSAVRRVLKAGDVVIRAGNESFPGVMLRPAEVAVFNQCLRGGEIEIIRENKKEVIRLESRSEDFRNRDYELFAIRN
jgi:hypothetical protein